MEGRVRTRIEKLRRSMSLTGALVALSVGVIVPVVLATSVGIVALAIGDTSETTVFGVLFVSFAAAAIGGAVVTVILVGKRARVARLQADFISNITHELRTPLAAIRMYAQTLIMGRLEGDRRRTEESLETIIRETDWLETMIDRVLTWRAASQDREPPSMEAGPIGTAVEVAVARFERMVAPGEVQLERRFNSMHPVLHDEDGIASITLNLLINAYKYTGTQKRIIVGLADRPDEVELFVDDNGVGIPPAEVGKIFDPFYRVDERLRGKASGAGLGLAIVRHQVRIHGGQVVVESKEGQGAKFTVIFPVAAGGQN